jgi:hypothetical protein
MQQVVGEAESQGLNPFLCAASCMYFIPRRVSVVLIRPCRLGKPGFYEKFGFKEVGKPVMLAEGTVEGVSSGLVL